MVGRGCPACDDAGAFLRVACVTPSEPLAPEPHDSARGPRDSSVIHAPDSGGGAESGAKGTGVGDPDPGRADSGGDTAPPPEPPPDLRVAGPFAVAVAEGAHTAASGCVLHDDPHTPVDGTAAPLVVLLHGLERSRENMADWAAHSASWGLAVATPDQCRCSVDDLDQEQNGRDAVELAAALGSGATIHAGHSAGGLAAFVAAAEDPGAGGLLGLDATEWLDIRAGVAPGNAVPAHGLLGDPSLCNLDQSTVGLFTAVPGGRLLGLPDPDHRDVERPTVWVCTVPCGTGSNDRFSDEAIQATMLGLSTAFLLGAAGLDDDRGAWWEPGGKWYVRLAADGSIYRDGGSGRWDETARAGLARAEPRDRGAAPPRSHRWPMPRSSAA